jgi:hypothetical protein
MGCWWLVSAPELPPTDAATVIVPHASARALLAPQPVRAFDSRGEVNEEAAFPDRIAALLPAADGRVSVLIPGADATRVVEAPRGVVTPDALRAAPAVPRAVAYSRRSGTEPLLLAGDGRVSCLEANGKTTSLYGNASFSDPIVLDVAAGRGCTGYVTTRASREGHLRVRFLAGSGSVSIRVDARQPALSPLGRNLALTVLEPRHERYQLAIVPNDGRGRERLVTRGSGHVAHPAWSPDGTSIAFLSETVRDPIQYAIRTGRVHLFVTDLEGQLVQLTAGGDLELIRPLWTKRGIYVVARGSQPSRQGVLLRITPPR